MHDLSSTVQRAKLPIILAAAQLAKDEVHQLQDIARSITGGQGFHIQVSPGVPTGTTPSYIIPAYPSQAERTLFVLEGGNWKRFWLGDVAGMLLGGWRMQQPTINGSGESD